MIFEGEKVLVAPTDISVCANARLSKPKVEQKSVTKRSFLRLSTEDLAASEEDALFIPVVLATLLARAQCQVEREPRHLQQQ